MAYPANVATEEMTRLRQFVDQLEQAAKGDLRYRRKMQGVWEFVSASLEEMNETSISFADFNLDHDSCENCRRMVGFLTAVCDMVRPDDQTSGAN